MFNEAELEQDPKAPEPDEKTIIVPEHKRKPKGSLEDKIKELPSEDVFLDIPEDEKFCSSCGKPLRRMGKKFLRKEIQSIPKSMKVVNYYAYTYTCDYCEKEKGVSRIYSVHAPEPLIKHSYASPSLVADVMTQKYVDGIPLARENSKAAVGYNYCNKLFALERKWKNLNNAQREENRRNQAEKLVDEYFLWVHSVDPVSGSKLEDAVKYALNQEQYLRAFLNNGEVEISDNFAENAIRPFVIGRKNWLFSDTVKGAKSSAIVYSLIETAKANGVEPYAYLALVLTDMQYIGKPFSNETLESLMPWSEEMKQSIISRT